MLRLNFIMARLRLLVNVELVVVVDDHLYGYMYVHMGFYITMKFAWPF